MATVDCIVKSVSERSLSKCDGTIVKQVTHESAGLDAIERWIKATEHALLKALDVSRLKLARGGGSCMSCLDKKSVVQ